MLKSLELFGFKSFADRTLFEFSPGITCVVGPNGSGKSNVVDALKWILGDQSAKSLRGKDMSDVIFNGSSGRRASGFAEATLAFDNTQGLLPIDSAEVSIGRRLYQSGDSEYLLNGSAVRLKDIRDVFMGTGAGTAAYSIIEQGRVDQILQANPTTRRLVFEEAAGISKFKARRIDAERRLERVAQNLLRLTDIVDEVESQLNSTRSQATKAARFREVSTELKALWTGLAADDFRHLSQKLDEKHDRLDLLKQQEADILERVAKIEQQRHETDQSISEFDDKLIDHERTIASNRQAMATHESTMHHQSTRLQEITVELDRLRTQRASLKHQVHGVESEYHLAQQQLHDFAKEYETVREELEQKEIQTSQIRERISIWRSTIAESNSQLKVIERNKSTAIERSAVLRSQAEAYSKRSSDLQHEIQRSDELLERANTGKRERQKLVEEAEVAYRAVQQAIENLQSNRATLSDQKTLAGNQLSELKERRSAEAARLAVLDELEQRQEGIAIGVQEILKRSKTSHFPPWNRMLGLVRDLIDVPMELAPIIDAALAERAQYIATSDLESLLDYLDRGAAPIDGRVGFVGVKTKPSQSHPPSPALPQSATPLSSEARTSGSSAVEVELTGQPGVFGRADRLIADSERSPGIAAAVLSDTWIVETLDDARRLIASHSAEQKIRFVTLQGEVLSPAGELFVGTVPHESSIVSRKSELRQLRNNIHQHDRNIEALLERQSVLGSSIESKQTELASARRELEEKASSLSECSALLAGEEKEGQRLSAERNQKQQQLDQLSTKSQEAEQEIAELQNELNQFIEEEQKLKQSIQEIESEIQGAEKEIQKLAQEMKSQQLEMAKHEERLSSLRDRQAHLEKEHRQTLRQSEEAQQQSQQAEQSLRRGRMTILNAEQNIATHAIALETTVKETRQFFLERDSLRALRKALSKQEDAEHKQRRVFQDQQHELEIAIQNLRHQLTGTADRIFEEFQIPLDKLVSSGVSAYRIYLEERYGEDVAAKLNTEGDSLEESENETATEADAHELEAGASSENESELSDGSEDSIDDIILPSFEEIREELESRVDRLRRKIKSMGHVNTEALESLEELENRYNHMNHQLLDLQEAKAALEDIIRTINGESERIFIETFETIRTHFQELFRKLFGGGDADIILEDPNDVLECGIDIVARPPGKELRSISLLSGGEKTMTAVGLLFAMFKSKPSPYCVLDEVDAALDEANVDRYVAVVKEFVEMTQFVVITHRKRTMTAANILYGVTMEQAGVSKRISVSFEDVNDNGEIRNAA
ncbi:chromosome segregation protein SMC [Thalassoglobus sp.]|uniref:chromosome segregation protein SMC n=1 Tax=Thalassoglobus sp. TaxID=2795869 RepID=UPI003AA98C8A